MGKGSKMRPSQVERKVFEDNWDRCFKKVQKELTELNADGNEDRGRYGEDLRWESANPLERPYEPDDDEPPVAPI